MKQLVTHFLVLILVVSASINLQAQCTSVPQVNSVINGDFEDGYIASGPGSFTSDQTYVYDPSNAANSALMDQVIANPGGGRPCAWNSDGRFHIASYFGPFICDGGNYNGHPFLSESDGRYDHTQGIGGTGKYLMIDSKNGPIVGLGITLWEQDVSVIANENYYFSAWFINFSPVSNGANRVLIRFVVEAFNSGGTSIGVYQLGAAFSPADASRGNAWEQAFRTWVAPVGAVTARLGLYNQTANVQVGNDVAIDDISFTNGCQDIVGNIPPPPNLGPDINICSTNGTITLNSNVATNAGAGRTFTWYSGTGATQTQIVAPSTSATTHNITAPGTYRVCVFEATGGACAKSSTIVITESQTISLGPDESLCQPNATTVALTSTLGNPGATYSYSWTRNAAAFPGTGSSNTATSTGTYVINATHPTRAACNATDTKIVTNTNSMTTNIGADVNLCSSPNAVFTSSLTGTAFTYQWMRDGVNIPGATTSSYTATIPGAYTLNITHPVAGCNFSDVANVTNSNPVTANSANFCAPAAKTVNLSVTGTGSFNWFAASSGGPALATNTTSFTTPAISTTTTYYVEDMTSATGNALPGASSLPQQDYNYHQTMKGTEFTTLKNNVTLNSVDLWVGSWSTVPNLVICLQNSSGTTISSVNVPSLGPTAASAVKYTVALGFSIPVMGTYRLALCGGSGGSLQGETFSSSVTDASNTITFTQTFAQDAWNNKYNFFQNVNFNAGANSCGRLPVTAYLTGSCPAPVTLVSFEGVLKNNAVNLSWITTQEINASHYVIERSYDGSNFTAIGTVTANNVPTISTYEHTDANPGASGIIYYRLVQVDFDGTENYSEIISVTIHKAEMTVYPNPNKGVFNLSLSAALDATITLELLNTLGQVVYSETLTSETGALNKEIDIRGFSAGVYYLKVQAGTEGWTERIVKE